MRATLWKKAPAGDFFSDFRHPYTKKLFASLPGKKKRNSRLAVIEGAVPSLAQRFVACRFADRCDYAWNLCHEVAPRWLYVATHHGCRCHLQDPQVTRPADAPVRGQVPVAGAVGAEESCLTVRDEGVLIRVKDLKVHFPVQKGIVPAHRWSRAGGRRRVHGVESGVARWPSWVNRVAVRRRWARPCCSC